MEQRLKNWKGLINSFQRNDVSQKCQYLRECSGDAGGDGSCSSSKFTDISFGISLTAAEELTSLAAVIPMILQALALFPQ
jgi:hypothetical protein